MAALVRAVERGVDVRVMTPAVEASDAPYVQRASHHNFGRLLSGGVRIFEYQKTLLHQKMITVDGEWSGIGSSNFDDRSFKINDEITVGLVGSEVAEQFEEIFESDLKYCEEQDAEEWGRRPWWMRAVDAFHHLFNGQL